MKFKVPIPVLKEQGINIEEYEYNECAIRNPKIVCIIQNIRNECSSVTFDNCFTPIPLYIT